MRPARTATDSRRVSCRRRLQCPGVCRVSSRRAPPSLKLPIPVQVGVKIDRISEVDSAGEDFTVIGSVRMDWRDPNLAFSPDTCNCAFKLYTEKEFDRFLADARSSWPDFSFYNQQGKPLGAEPRRGRMARRPRPLRRTLHR